LWPVVAAAVYVWVAVEPVEEFDLFQTFRLHQEALYQWQWEVVAVVEQAEVAVVAEVALVILAHIPQQVAAAAPIGTVAVNQVDRAAAAPNQEILQDQEILQQ